MNTIQLQEYAEALMLNFKRVLNDRSDFDVDWPNLQDVFEEGEIGDAKLSHFSVSEAMSFATGLCEHVDIKFTRPGDYVRLVANNELQMSDTRMEKISNTEFVLSSQGDVLIAGLGIGMSLIPILKKPEVRTVTVIELNQNVIKLVEPQIRIFLPEDQSKKLRIINADIFSWKPVNGRKWQTIWFDIWAHMSSDNLPEMAKLEDRFKHRVDRTGEFFFGSWHEEFCRKMRKVENDLEKRVAKIKLERGES